MSATTEEQAKIVLDYTKNPFGLVYEYALTENEPGKVNLHPVTYRLRDIDVSANVYTPPNYDPSGSYPTITVAHPNGGVKEQVAGRYAQRLAKLGYITITADAAIRRYYPQMKYRHDGFTAKFDSGVCTRCDEPIQVGEQIEQTRGGRIARYAHVEPCPGAAPIQCSICGDNWYQCDCP